MLKHATWELFIDYLGNKNKTLRLLNFKSSHTRMKMLGTKTSPPSRTVYLFISYI